MDLFYYIMLKKLPTRPTKNWHNKEPGEPKDNNFFSRYHFRCLGMCYCCRVQALTETKLTLVPRLITRN